jgi:5S rRNA maturation endonuclease (ribonuclease M5)
VGSWNKGRSWIDSNGTTTIKGLIIPVDWDEKGNVTATAISTHFEEEYMVDDNARGEELIAFLRQRAKVSGVIIENAKGKKVITVKHYEVLEE